MSQSESRDASSENLTATHLELEHARQACAALDAKNPLQLLMQQLLDTVAARLQQLDGYGMR